MSYNLSLVKCLATCVRLTIVKISDLCRENAESLTDFSVSKRRTHKREFIVFKYVFYANVSKPPKNWIQNELHS